MEIWNSIDLFCGAGGVTEGIINSNYARVTHAVNHSEAAIFAHSLRHPETVHLESDIRDYETSQSLPAKTNILWASLECTNYSIAKGGQSRDADSRTLANEMPRYVIRTNCDYLIIENVKEFLDWGPLIPKRDKNGRKMKILKGKNKGKYIYIPDPKRKGQNYLKWKYKIMSLGYDCSERILNSADFGAYTSRKRLFIIFAKKGLPISWPDPTHSKNSDSELFGLKKWKPCKEKIDLKNEGQSIFGRKKPLTDNTLKRIAYGINKYCMDDSFILKYYGSSGQTSNINEPLHTVTTKDRHALIKINKFITQNIHRQPRSNSSIDCPLPTILKRDEKAIVTIKQRFVTKQYTSNGQNNQVSSLKHPLGTIKTSNTHSLVTVEKKQFIQRYFSNKYNVSSLDKPLGSLTTGLKDALITTEWGGFILLDIKMRFLTTKELADITGFRDWESLGRTKTEQLKHIGNAVPPIMPEKIIESLYLSNHTICQKVA